MSKRTKKDPVKYRKLVNQFREECVTKDKESPIQILDCAQNFSLWLDEKGYEIGRRINAKGKYDD